MASMGPTKTVDTEHVAANLLKLARLERELTQRALATAAGVPHSTVARIESGAMQPTLPLLYRLVAAADLEPRIRLLTYDAHDDVLDALAARDPATQAELERARDHTLVALDQSKPEQAMAKRSKGKQRVG